LSVRTRPEILFKIFTPVTSIKGVGPRISNFITKTAGPNIVDLLWHLPTGIIDRKYSPDLRDAKSGSVVTLTLRIDKHISPPIKNKRIPYRINCSNSSGNIVLVYFHSRDDFLQSILPIGEERIISGRLELFDGLLQITHPDVIAPISERDKVLRIHPTYPLTEGLSQNVIRKAINESLDRTPVLAEWHDPYLLKERGWPNWHEAVLRAHNPESKKELDPNSVVRQRLAYDELLASQLAIALIRGSERRRLGRKTLGNGSLRKTLTKILTYKLTSNQISAIDQIINDMSSETRMLRLLQGDVGSGKTIVSLFAMLNAVETGQQAVLMAPTEILARQHLATIAPLINPKSNS
jgi:ATP-dependent DNA helicase RecG